ncbi:metallophosphoesterase [Actinosynnema sp. NPDC020468]|uniref:metallophosphoesterase n=1 Tax=Actinosynnema sp. NPDC020468 TaxID=3154488 RepID=UPI0033FA1FE3
MLLAHLSDTHLRADALRDGPVAALHLALGRVLAVDPRPDCVVITGDLCEYGHDAYGLLRDLLARFPIPVHLVLGNHDDPDAFGRAFPGAPTRYAVDYPDAAVVVLDSRRPDGPGGLLGPDQLEWLDRTLGAKPAYVCLHHPPVAVGLPLLDAINLADAADLAAVLDRHPVVRVLAGHVHRPVTAPFGRTLVTTAPSTYRQTSLTLRADRVTGYTREPTAFLLHRDDVTHVVQVSHATPLEGAF